MNSVSELYYDIYLLKDLDDLLFTLIDDMKKKTKGKLGLNSLNH